ncbi:hypothetical protein SUGI_0248460 [Cryptomeria japonica]|nr:hypothetical protein SUGI_0248460 [Cryptomeria japonica]
MDESKEEQLKQNGSMKQDFMSLNHNKGKTIVLDLDTTLVNVSTLPLPQYDFTISIKAPQTSEHRFIYYVQKRPGLDILLQELSNLSYEIIVFTSAHKDQADAIIDKLEQLSKTTMDIRLYRKERTKDISKLGIYRFPRNLIIVDETAEWYKSERKNVFEVKPFKGDLSDRELWRIIMLCKKSSTTEDVRNSICVQHAITNVKNNSVHNESARLAKKNKTIVLEMYGILCSVSTDPQAYHDFTVCSFDQMGTAVPFYVLERPGVHELLDRLNKNYNIIVFTDFYRGCVDLILDKLDVNFQLKQRLYIDSCRRAADGFCAKDLSKAFPDFSPRDFILVDHNPLAFQFQPENGILIKRFQGDLQDRALYKLLEFCHVAAMCKDVRQAISTYSRSSTSSKNSVNSNAKGKRKLCFWRC